MERQTRTGGNLISGSLGFGERDGQVHATLWISVLPEIPASPPEGHKEPGAISLCAAAAPVCARFRGYGLWTSHREPKPRCDGRLFPRRGNSQF